MDSRQRRRRIAGAGSSPKRPPIGDGEMKAQPLSDTLDGIKFEVAKLVDYVKYYSQGQDGDDLVVKTVEEIAHACPSKDKNCLAETLFNWVKSRFIFMNDPYGGEKIKTATRQLRDLETPREVLAVILAPLLAMKPVEGSVLPQLGQVVVRRSDIDLKWVPMAKSVGDCDEASAFMATMLAAGGIKSRFILGGRPNAEGACEWHHIWCQGLTPSGWVDMDVSEPDSTYGWSFPFKCHDTIEIFDTDESPKVIQRS